MNEEEKNKKKYAYILTVGCFDRLHGGHVSLLRRMGSMSDRLIVGVHDNASIQEIKNITDVQPLSVRVRNVQSYAADVFRISDADPTAAIRDYLARHPGVAMPPGGGIFACKY